MCRKKVSSVEGCARKIWLACLTPPTPSSSWKIYMPDSYTKKVQRTKKEFCLKELYEKKFRPPKKKVFSKKSWLFKKEFVS